MPTDEFDHAFPEELVNALARAINPSDFWQETAEYPTKARAEWESGQVVSRWDAAEALNRLWTQGYELAPRRSEAQQGEPESGEPCGRGPCSGSDGHPGTCAEASGWDESGKQGGSRG